MCNMYSGFFSIPVLKKVLLLGKEMRKNKLSGYQRDIEQAFMSSIVQAELSQGLQGRSSSPESISKVCSTAFLTAA